MEPNDILSDKERKHLLIEKAQLYLGGVDMAVGTVTELASKLSDLQEYAYARRLRTKLYENRHRTPKLIYDLSVAIYKDEDLPSDQRFDLAERVLLENFENDLKKVNTVKAFGILGAIYKNKWKYNSRIENLYRSLEYYELGHEKWWNTYSNNTTDENVSHDGYCAVNAAFLYDQLAIWHTRIEGFQNRLGREVAHNFRQKARDLRLKIDEFSQAVAQRYTDAWQRLKEKELSQQAYATSGEEAEAEKKDASLMHGWYWFYVTWAEALLGLEQFDAALQKFILSKKVYELKSTNANLNLPGDDPTIFGNWKQEVTLRQGIELANNLFEKDHEKRMLAYQTLSPLGSIAHMDNPGEKLGLALSGGGFRAALFHIGVLARLAEENRLKDIQVISCVSGGSIIGAYYYLKIKQKLEEKQDETEQMNDHEIRDMYLGIVREIRDEFLDRIGPNLRMGIMGNTFKMLKLLVKPGSRSATLQKLYEKHLYAPLLPKKGPIFMGDLFVNLGPGFDFKRDNWKRKCKVPTLVLNATNLNTGHNWQFTASWMGESPNYINNEFDALPTLRRMYYKEAPQKFRQIPLSQAVSASSCVPVLFYPVKLKNLYYDEKNKKSISVKLVDGGVHDNQGIYALLEQECNTLIVSDSSGQMGDHDNPSSLAPLVFSRTNEIFQARVRDLQFVDLSARKQSGFVKDFRLMHLTKDLESEVINWTDCRDKYVPADTSEKPAADIDKTTYNIRKEIQRRIAQIRTDLDSFHETEALALMYSGYKMTEASYRPRPKIGLKDEELRQAALHAKAWEDYWNWEGIRTALETSERNGRVERQLKAASNLLFKLFAVSDFWRIVKFISIPGLLLLAIIQFGFPAITINEHLFINISLFLWMSAKSIVVGLFKWTNMHPVLAALIALGPWLLFYSLNAWYLAVGKVDKKKGFWHFFKRYLPYTNNKYPAVIPEPPVSDNQQA